MPIITPEAEARARQLCNRLAIERIARGLTQRDMAAHFGDQQGNVQVIETMKRRPVLPTFISYAWALGLEVALVGEHHLPLLDLTEAEVEALLAGARVIAAADRRPILLSALDKLTTSEETSA